MITSCPDCGARNRVPPHHLHEAGRCGRCKSALPATAAPLDITDPADFDAIVQGARVPVLVDFWATWCGPCLVTAPHVQRVAEEMKGRALVLKVDTDRLPALAGRFDVRGIPSFFVFKDGKPAMQQAGAQDTAALRRFIESAGETASGARPV